MDIPRGFGSSIPGWSDMTRVLQAQNRLLEQLPATLVRLTEAINQLVPAVAEAVETVSAAQRVTAHAEALINDLDGPIRRLIPAIERLATALDHPAVDAMPGTLQRIHETVLPVADSVAQLRARITSARGTAKEASRRLRTRVQRIR